MPWPRRSWLAVAPCAPILYAILFGAAVLGQEPAPRPAPEQTDEVIRVESNLMQAGVTVIDKQGRFVEGLRAEQFEVLVDGKPQKIAFFDRVAAGTPEERAKTAAVPRGSATRPAPPPPGPALPDQGRVVLFFVDDLHMAPENVRRGRKAIEHFIDHRMGENDVAALATASGQLGFLQQLTSNKNVLRAAAARLKPGPQMGNDGQLPAMNEHVAKAIVVEGDRDAMENYIQILLRDGMKRTLAERLVKERAHNILQLTDAATKNTLRSLGSMVRTVAPLPGRKLVLFLSDGFLLNRQSSDVGDALHKVTDAAVRSGFVLYTLDTRGLAVESWLNAAEPGPSDLAGQLMRATRGEMSASQEALHLLAEQTGGRALLNTNSISSPLGRALEETATYYVVAWESADGREKDGKFRRLEVTVKDRPELLVLAQGGFIEARADGPPQREAGGEGKKVKPGEELKAALAGALPVRDLPTSLQLSYSDLQKSEAVMTALVSVQLGAVGQGQSSGPAVEVEGYVVNFDGKIGSRFRGRLNSAEQGERGNVSYRHQIKLAPGIYQVRAAARDLAGGRIGSAAEWIEIPDLRTGRLTLGSLVVGERPQAAGGLYTAANFVEQRSPGHRFTRGSSLRFMTYIYNAAGSPQGAPPDLEVQIQVLQGAKVEIDHPGLKVNPAMADAGGIAYGGEIELYTLSPGRHVLQVTVRDRVSRADASQRMVFWIE